MVNDYQYENELRTCQIAKNFSRINLCYALVDRHGGDNMPRAPEIWKFLWGTNMSRITEIEIKIHSLFQLSKLLTPK